MNHREHRGHREKTEVRQKKKTTTDSTDSGIAQIQKWSNRMSSKSERVLGVGLAAQALPTSERALASVRLPLSSHLCNPLIRVICGSPFLLLFLLCLLLSVISVSSVVSVVRLFPRS
jgi:hypothetical protein